MYYIVLNEYQLMYALSSRSVIINPLYKFIPIIGNDQFIIRVKLFNYEKKQLKFIDKYTYILDKPLHFENRRISILYNNKEQLDLLDKMNHLYLEIKDTDKYDIRCVNDIRKKDFRPIVSEYHDSKNKSILGYKHKLNIQFDRIKGAVYMFFCYYYELSEILYNNYNIFNEEIRNFNEIINLIKSKNKLDRELYYSSKRMLNILKKRDMDYIRERIIDMKLFSRDNYKLDFNHHLLELTKREYIFLRNILSYIIKRKNDEFNVQDIVIFSKSMIQSNDIYNDLQSDINILSMRILEEDFSQDINNIKSDIVKNMFAFCIHYNNHFDLHTFIKNKDINKSYIAYTFYGAMSGYSKIPNSLISDEYIDISVNKELLLKSIHELDHLFFNLSETMMYKRDRIHYSIINILNKYFIENRKSDVKINGYFLSYKSKNKMYNSLEITDNNEDFIVIDYWRRKGIIAKSVKYFDDKTNRVQKLSNSNQTIQNKYVFSYYFIKDEKKKPLDLLLEEKYMIILNDIENYFKKR